MSENFSNGLTSKTVTLDTATAVSLPIDAYNRLVEEADKNFEVWVNTNKRWASTWQQNKRLRTALERIWHHPEDPELPAHYAAKLRTIAGEALSAEPSAHETSDESDWKDMRTHELRYIESVLLNIRKQDGEGARESANDTLAWLRNRLTVGAAEKANLNQAKPMPTQASGVSAPTAGESLPNISAVIRICEAVSGKCVMVHDRDEFHEDCNPHNCSAMRAAQSSEKAGDESK